MIINRIIYLIEVSRFYLALEKKVLTVMKHCLFNQYSFGELVMNNSITAQTA